MKLKYLLIITICLPLTISSQDDLLNEIDTDSIGKEYAIAAFKGLNSEL